MKIINYTLLLIGYILVCVYVCLTCNSCGNSTPYRLDGFYMHEVYNPYVQQFKEELSKRNIRFPGRTTKFHVGDTGSLNWAGRCDIYEVETTKDFKTTTKLYYHITIRPEYLNKPNPLKSLIFHELGHCELDLPDDYEDYNTFMFWSMPSSDVTEEEVMQALDYGLKQLKR